MKNQLLQHNRAIRSERFQSNRKLDVLLDELATLLNPIQKQLRFVKPVAPVGCIVGNPRSGTTLFMQWIASLGHFSYPTNLLTRFSYAPYIGSLIQKMLFDPEYDYQGDFEELKTEFTFSSNLGKSKGAMSCNEFQHFFRNHMPNFDLEWLNNKLLDQVDCEGISSGLASIENGLEKPFFTKANILQFNLEHFSRKMPFMLWVHIVREPIYVMQSLMLAREKYYGDRTTWFSAKPKEFHYLKEMDIYQQIAGQVYYTEKAIDEALKHIDQSKWLRVEYEKFCSAPAAVYHELRGMYLQHNVELPVSYSGHESFEITNTHRLPENEIDALKSAYAEFKSGNSPLGS